MAKMIRVKGIMADHINTMIGGLYDNQYIRDLIRNDMLKYSSYDLEESLRKGYEQLASKEYDDQPFDEIVDLVKKDFKVEKHSITQKSLKNC